MERDRDQDKTDGLLCKVQMARLELTHEVLMHLEAAVRLASVASGRLRAKLAAFRGARVGEKVHLGSRVKIDRPWCIELGERVYAEDNVWLKVIDDEARLSVGGFTFIGRGTQFDVSCETVVGDHTLIAPGCFITDHTHIARGGMRIDQQASAWKPVHIGSDVWLGCGVIVLPGVTIGDGAIIGAGAVVTADVPPMAVSVGVPARFQRFRTSEDKPSSQFKPT